MSGYNSEGYNGVSASEGGGDVGVSVVPPHSHFTSASSSSAAGGLSGSPSAPRTALHVTWWIVFLFSVGALVAPFYSYKMTLNGNAGLALLDGMTTYEVENYPVCEWYNSNAVTDEAASAKAMGPAAVGTAVIFHILLVVAFLGMELLNPHLQLLTFFIRNRVPSDDSRLRLSNNLLLAAAGLSFLSIVWFFCAISAGGWDQLAFETEMWGMIGFSPSWVNEGTKIGSMGAGCTLPFLMMFLLPPAWWFLRTRI